MPSNLDVMQEAVKRGLPLPPDKQAIYDEAVKRGLIEDVRPESAAASPAPEGEGSSVMGTIRSIGTGIAQGSIGLANTIGDVGAWAEDKAAGWMGFTPEQMDAMREARGALGVGSSRRTSDVIGKVEEQTGEFYQPQGTIEEYGNTFGQFLPGLVTGPGKTFVQGVKNAFLPTILGAGASETAGQATKGSWVEPYARFIGGLGGGLLGGGINNWASKPAAPYPEMSPGAQARVGNALNDTFDTPQAAAQRAAELGDEAMTLNMGRRPAQQASTIAAYPGESSSIIGEAVNKQIGRSGDRAIADWEGAVGPSVSRYEAQLQAAATKNGASSLYEVAKGRPVNPAPIHNTILKQLTEAGNDPQARAAIKEISDLLIDPNTGSLAFDAKTGAPSLVGGTQAFINDAGALVNARIRVAEMISKLGKEVSNSPGDDLFAVGKRTSVGARLNAVRKAINEVLHQDETLKAADKIWSSAERTQNAFEFGRTKLLGRGDSVIEPEALAAKLNKPNLTVEERAAIAKGLSRRGNALLGDVAPNRNDGKAMGDAIATENNLARIGQVSGPDASGRVRQMAAREDLFAKDANRITGNSTTAEKLIGQTEFPSPLLGNKQYANIGQRTLLGVMMEGGTRLVDAMTRGLISNGRTKLASDAAKLLTKTGPERDRAVRDLMAYSNSLPKGHPLKAVIVQAVTPSLSGTVPALLGGN